MQSEWETAKLEDVIELLTDYHANGSYQTLKANVTLLDQHDYAVMIRTTNFEQEDFSTNVKFISEDAYHFLKKSKVYPNDLIMNKIANAGSCYFMPDLHQPVSLAMNLFLIRINEKKAIHRFIYLYLKANEAYVKNFAEGSVTKTITKAAVRNLEIKLPPLPEQKAIAHIMGSLDDKIELNRKMNETLEAMAQAMFKSWFVDFDPVIDNALANGNEIPDALRAKAELRRLNAEKNNSSLITHNSSLFPSEFIHTEELGWIPKGWKAGPISELATLNPESWSKKNAPESVLYIDLANTKNGSVNLTTPYSFSDAPSRARRVLRKGDTIIGVVRPGNRSFAFIHRDGLTGSTGFAVMRPKEEYLKPFIYLNLIQDDVIDCFAHLADGAAYPAIKPEVVAGVSSVLPCESILKAFDKLTEPLISNIGKREQQGNSLSSLRDTLLPKLLSGELRIKDAEKLIMRAEL